MLSGLYTVVLIALAYLHGVSAGCLTTHTVRSWDGKAYPLCDDKFCGNHDVPMPPPSKTNRFSAKFDAYQTAFSEIKGWLAPDNARLVEALTAYQHSLGIFGTVGEIGVYFGKYLCAIAGYASTTEPVIAIDLFANQSNPEVKYDTNRGVVEDALKLYVSHTNNIVVLDQDSTTMHPDILKQHNMPRIRYFSVDGGHMMEIALNDMNFARCNIVQGGIVTLDDIQNFSWLGVPVAAFLFATSQDDLVPFLLVANKLYYTTPSHHATYLAFLKELPGFTCNNIVPGFQVSRRSIGPWEICWGGFAGKTTRKNMA